MRKEEYWVGKKMRLDRAGQPTPSHYHHHRKAKVGPRRVDPGRVGVQPEGEGSPLTLPLPTSPCWPELDWPHSGKAWVAFLLGSEQPLGAPWCLPVSGWKNWSSFPLSSRQELKERCGSSGNGGSLHPPWDGNGRRGGKGEGEEVPRRDSVTGASLTSKETDWIGW